MQGTLRTLTPELRESMKQSVERIVTLGAETLRGKGEITWGDGMPPLVNDDTVVDLVAAAAEKTIGADRIFTFDSPPWAPRTSPACSRNMLPAPSSA